MSAEGEKGEEASAHRAAPAAASPARVPSATESGIPVLRMPGAGEVEAGHRGDLLLDRRPSARGGRPRAGRPAGQRKTRVITGWPRRPSTSDMSRFTVSTISSSSSASTPGVAHAAQEAAQQHVALRGPVRELRRDEAQRRRAQALGLRDDHAVAVQGVGHVLAPVAEEDRGRGRERDRGEGAGGVRHEPLESAGRSAAPARRRSPLGAHRLAGPGRRGRSPPRSATPRRTLAFVQILSRSRRTTSASTISRRPPRRE